MISIQISTKLSNKNWNKLVCSVSEGTIFQSSAWGDYLEKSGFQPLYFLAIDEVERIVGLLLAHKAYIGADFFRDKHFNVLKIFKPVVEKMFSIIQWHYGPLILEKSREKEIMLAFIEAIDKFCKSEKVYQIKFIPTIHHSIPNDNNLEQEFKLYNLNAERWGTYLIDLTQDKESLLGKIKREARKSIKLGVENGLFVERVKNEEELNSYLQILDESRKRLGLHHPPHYPNNVMWETLGKNQCLEVFVAKKNNNVLAGMGLLHFNKIIYEIAYANPLKYPGSDHAGDLIKWEIILWGKLNGYKYYDLAGVSPLPQNKKDQNIKQFKKKFGNLYLEFFIWEKIFSSKKRFIINCLRKLQK